MIGGNIIRLTCGDHKTELSGGMKVHAETVDIAAGKQNCLGGKEGTVVGKPEKPETGGKHIIRGWWSADREGKEPIREAVLDDTVYFHVETKDIPDDDVVFMSLYDDDVKRANEEKDSHKGSDRLFLNGKQDDFEKVKANKVVKEINFKFFSSWVAEEEDKTIELFLACSCRGEDVELPVQFHDYLKVKEAEPLIIYVCGYWNKDMPYAGAEWGEDYWGALMKNKAKEYFKTSKEYFINGAGNAFSSGRSRYNSGVKLANERLKNNSSKFYKEVFRKKRKVIIISHSMGRAFSEGILEVLKREKINIDKFVHLSPADTSDFNINYPDRTYQIDYTTVQGRY